MLIFFLGTCLLWPMMRINLPDADITLFENFFSIVESNEYLQKLLNEINWRHDKIKIFGKEIFQPRLTALYGDEGLEYTYSGLRMQPEPWNYPLSFIKNRIENIAGVAFTTCLLNLYRDGKDSMGWHQDNEKELGKNPIIASVSFGAMRNFQLKHIHQHQLGTITIPLGHGSLLLMKGPTQHFWKHQIPKTKKPLSARINLTFRRLRME